jgi:16S rRNA (guanine527-N7)-methyltransferase
VTRIGGPEVDVIEDPQLSRQVRELFGARPDGVELASAFATILATTGIEHGVIGPGERARIWDRHLLNCAVLSELLPAGSHVVDVGSGAGLPGLALACARSDLSITLVEPLERRVRFLNATVAELGLGSQVRVVHGRAGVPALLSQVDPGPFVTARAVAPLDRLVRWCLPLLAVGGQLLAMKGRSAEEEIAQAAGEIAALGGGDVSLMFCGTGTLAEPVRVVSVRRVKGASKR